MREGGNKEKSTGGREGKREGGENGREGGRWKCSSGG